MLFRYVITIALLIVGLFGYLQLGTSLSLNQQWHLVLGLSPEAFSEFQYLYAMLPRAILALIIGSSMAFCGSLLQQMTRNRLASPMTFGLSSGAWLALIMASLWAPALLVNYSAWVAMLGALVSSVLIWIIAGRHNLSGLPIILAGIAIHILCSTLASALILLNEQVAENLFIWGAGDLTQTDWHWVVWLLPKLALLPLVAILAHRPLMLLRLGEHAASARGMSVWPSLLLLYAAVLWVVGSAIAAVGVIGFISLLAPNIARAIGSHSALDELCMSILLGALLLLGTDVIAILASQWSPNVVPSGTTAALIGAPFLLLLARSRFSAQDHSSLQLPASACRLSAKTYCLLALSLLTIIAVTLCFSPMQNGVDNNVQWLLHWPSEMLFKLRWPAIIAAAAGGAGMAIAGVILQRLIRNPLASPDILGLSAGATMALVITSSVIGSSIHAIGPLIAFIGCFGSLMVLLLLGRRHNFAPNIVILIGISLTAFIEGLVQLTLAQGGEEVYSIISWLVGSTYHVASDDALWLFLSITFLTSIALLSRHWLTLLSAGDAMAFARGLSANRARLALLLLVTLLISTVTAFLGPLAFVGLLAPHMAAMLGARKAHQQLLLAPLLGLQLMLIADWLGRTIVYPAQLPAGVIAAVIGSGYFVYLMSQKRSTSLSMPRA